MRSIFFLLFSLVLFIGCAKDAKSYDASKSNFIDQSIHTNLHTALLDIRTQLLKNKTKQNISQIVVTSFVDLENLTQTTPFGRILGESMINELHSSGFDVIDFRGRDAILINENGEFYITRDARSLKDEIDNSNILVGTYSKFDQNSIAINVRILDFDTGKVLSTARVIYSAKECEILQNCEEESTSLVQIVEESN